MKLKFPSLRLIGTVFTFASACLLSNTGAAQSSFPQFEKSSCPSPFTTSGGKCSTNKPGYEGMINPNGKASCPAGWSRSTNYCTRHTKEEKSDKQTAKTSSAASGSSSPLDPDKTHFGKPVVKRINKKDELDFCPSGYFTSSARRIECITDKIEAPDVTAKQGKCPAGTTEEQGQYCTGSTTLTYQQLHQAFLYDFNGQYYKRKNNGLETVRADVEPALYVQARAAAEGKPAASAAATSESASSQASANASASATATESKNPEVKEAAKAIGSSLLKGFLKKDN
ncbi:hypothetical protein [Undibacterium sp. Ji22W]|uniref:hypothetical protein n=1 Tax=Undibacterium sp. Ji22W TaxID=3413038 RepID=UPI003BF3B89D